MKDIIYNLFIENIEINNFNTLLFMPMYQQFLKTIILSI